MTTWPKKLDGKEVVETFKTSYLIGAEGAKGMISPLIVYILADHLYRFRQVSVETARIDVPWRNQR
jgi:hypothetical protein